MRRFSFGRPRASRALALVAGMLVVVVAAWFARHVIMIGAAAILVDEDPVAPAQILVPSHSMSQETALEAALLYEQQVSPHIVMTDWIEEPVADAIRTLGIQMLDTTALNRYILEQSKVPASAITVLPEQVDGTGSEVAAIVAFAKRCHVTSLMVITARTHTARTRWLLRRKLPRQVRLSVRSPRFDRFVVDGWWRERTQSREMALEYMRWLNTVVFRDLWERPSQIHTRGPVPDCSSVTSVSPVSAGL